MIRCNVIKKKYAVTFSQHFEDGTHHIRRKIVDAESEEAAKLKVLSENDKLISVHECDSM